MIDWLSEAFVGLYVAIYSLFVHLLSIMSIMDD